MLPYFIRCSLILILGMVSSAAELPSSGRIPVDGTPRTLTAWLLFAQTKADLRVDPTRITDDGEKIDLGANPLDNWSFLETLAAKSAHHLEVGSGGKQIFLKPGKSLTSPAILGPFRLQAQDVLSKADLVVGRRTTDVTLQLLWEQKIHLFRVRALPDKFRASDDQGRDLLPRPDGSSIRVTEAQAGLSVRLSVDRSALKLATLEGALQITLADELLSFAIANPAEEATAILAKVNLNYKSRRAGGYRLIDIEFVYPPDFPLFESFEQADWLRDNRLELIAPDGKQFSTDNWEPTFTAKGVKVAYRFKETALPEAALELKGWKARVLTPSPLREVIVPFVLKELPLP